MHYYSVIVPVYNRPDEVKELLDSLVQQTYKNFEVILVEDGSTKTCKSVADSFSDTLRVRYYFKENSGQGFSRNFGFDKAVGDYLIVFDSDCIVPPHYFDAVNRFLEKQPADAFGGPDKAHASFSSLQKAISYSMTSVLTTGGIRGNKKHVGTFHPRSFNMGISRKVYDTTGGYKITRMGEDIELSIRILQSGFKTSLIPEAYVYHKRRTSLSQFYKQLHFFGRARVNVNRFWPGEMKLIHLLPLFFVLIIYGWFSTLFYSHSLFKLGAFVLMFYYLAIFLHSVVKNKSLRVGVLSIVTSFIQLYAYGMGIVAEVIRPRGNQFFAQK
ncbi:glycosyltransferase [Roseivirga sp. UBA838]|uniref:glycosyltransferase n=1 Tax=Roseivirga sp. UBA838 TaxID=1947393 RepID=UPI00257E9BAE|nr:glycosyltransferase [Roseivirga sp. UBA838]|tara:strand:- start:73405 stop:74385 length:981 start_codon:yes stop_codon:yes gene_type:complete